MGDVFWRLLTEKHPLYGIKMDILVTDQTRINAIAVPCPFVVVSIHDHDLAKPKIRKRPGLRAMLRLAFDDGEPPAPAGVKLMTAAQAEHIWRFVAKHRADVHAVVVHCEAGVSRGPAVAAALCQSDGRR